MSKDPRTLSRRKFAFAASTAVTAPPLVARQSQTPALQNTSTPPRREVAPERLPFEREITFARKRIQLSIEPIPMTDVRLLPSRFKTAQDANLAYLTRLSADRLLHNFRVNAGLPSSAEPLGGWEKPDCELRGHFVGHFLSACALMYSSTGDEAIKTKGKYVVSELAKCQERLGGGYLSAFPLEYFDRLDRRQKVWAPFYTIHKIMAGMLDMHEHCGSKQALEVLKGMADWCDTWTGSKPEEHMQDILNTEYGGMNEVLYSLSDISGEDRYATAGDRFTKKKFFNPLGLHRDELRGLHVNTHIPQVIGAARRYEISDDGTFQDVADYFWSEVTSARTYVTGGTSNAEAWLVEPRRLNAELKRSVDTTECCCAYNMLKLTRHLYTWKPDPRYFDYYERTLFNHRLAAIEPESGAMQYYLSIVPGAWKTFNTEDSSFWCCTGTGVEEFSKLSDSIYFRDQSGLYVNLFIPSEVNWKEKEIKIRQETAFPDVSTAVFAITAKTPVAMSLHLRIPSWTGPDAAVRVNGKKVDGIASPGSYFVLERVWKDGDRVSIDLPMRLRFESMPDEPTTKAVLYGPLVLAGQLGSSGITRDMVIGPLGPDLRHHPVHVPALKPKDSDPNSWIKAVSGPSLSFRTIGQSEEITLVPFDRVFGQRYSIYWTVT